MILGSTCNTGGCLSLVLPCCWIERVRRPQEGFDTYGQLARAQVLVEMQLVGRHRDYLIEIYPLLYQDI